MLRDLEDLDWGKVLEKLSTYAGRRLYGFGLCDSGSQVTKGEELAAEAIKHLFDTETKEREVSTEGELTEALGSIVNGLVSNLTRKSSTRREILCGDFYEDQLGDDERSPEQRIIDHNLSEKVMDVVLSRIEGDELLENIFFSTIDGEKPREQAEKLGIDVQDIYNARRRLKDHFRAVRKLVQSEMEEHTK